MLRALYLYGCTLESLADSVSVCNPPDRYPRLAILFGPVTLFMSSPQEEPPPTLWSRRLGSCTGLSACGRFSCNFVPEAGSYFWADAKFFTFTCSKEIAFWSIAISNGLSVTVRPRSGLAFPAILLFSWIICVLLVRDLGWDPPLLFNRCCPLALMIVSLSISS